MSPTLRELLAMGLEAQPDISRGGDDGLALAAELNRLHPDLRIVALTAALDPVDIARAARAGACAPLPKSGSLAEVLRALRTARVGRLLLQPGMVLDLVALNRRRSGERCPPAPRGPVLTAREQQVLELLGKGLDVNAIAKRLGIRLSTCRGSVQNVLAKLDAHTQLEAVVAATSRRLLRRDEGAEARCGCA